MAVEHGAHSGSSFDRQLGAIFGGGGGADVGADFDLVRRFVVHVHQCCSDRDVVATGSHRASVPVVLATFRNGEIGEAAPNDSPDSGETVRRRPGDRGRGRG